MLRVRNVLILSRESMLIQPHLKKPVLQVRLQHPLERLQGAMVWDASPGLRRCLGPPVRQLRPVITRAACCSSQLVQLGRGKMLLDKHPVRMRASVMSWGEPEDGIRIIAIRYGGRRNIRMLRDNRRVRHTPSKTAHIRAQGILVRMDTTLLGMVTHVRCLIRSRHGVLGTEVHTIMGILLG